MRSRLTACRLLLILPALFLMLQVSIALHHHHTYSYHDEQDSFHSVSTSIDKHVSAAVTIVWQQSHYPHYRPLVTCSPRIFEHFRTSFVVFTPTPSRAPPAIHV